MWSLGFGYDSTSTLTPLCLLSSKRPDNLLSFSATDMGSHEVYRKIQRNYDEDAYKWRHLVEKYFAKIKEFRGIATRYEKTDSSYTANWNLVAALIASKWLSTGPT